MTSKELNALIKKLQNGQMDVFDMVYYETKNVVYYTILSIIKDKSLSEDIMQETYLKALEKIHTFKPKYSFSSWIVMIARNQAINVYNKRKRELSFDPNVDEYIFGREESVSEKQLIIKEMMNFLDKEHREILIMKVIGNMKHREIAEVLGKPIGTVTWMYNEAINKLKSKFGNEVDL